MRRLVAPALLALCAGCQPRAGLPDRHGVASIDFCADQMVLGLLPGSAIRAVSREAASDRSFAAARARHLPTLRPQLEDIVALRPAVVVRSYAGDNRLTAQLQRLGIRVVQLGSPDSLAAASADLLRVGSELGATARAEQLVAALDRQVARAMPGGGVTPAALPTALYVTPGDVTTGPGSFVADVMAAAGVRPYRKRPGWGSLPVETMVREPPPIVLRAFFDSPRYRQDHWAASRHPVVQQAAAGAVVVEVSGGALACGNWLAGDAVARLAAARQQVTGR